MRDRSMPFLDHFGELRRRAIICALAAFAGMIAAYCLYDAWILNLLRGPLDALSGRSGNPFVLDNPLLDILKSSSENVANLQLNLHFIGPAEVFMVKLKVSFFAGAVLAAPIIFYQVWAFVSAGLKDKERRAVRIFMPASLMLFSCGFLIAYFMMLPVILYFLVIVSGKGLVPSLILSKYTSMVVMCCLSFGLVFQMPIIILFLTRIGLVSPKSLTAKRKYAILVMFILSAILTPPDVVTQIMMALPMIVLYEASIILSRFAWKKRQAAIES